MLRLLILCSLLFSPNHHGLSFKISRQEERIFQLGIIPNKAKSSISILETSGELETKTNPPQKISWFIIVAVLLILVVSPYLGILGIRSLHDQPLDKQSVLNKLCRDCTVLQIVFVVTWAMYIVTAKVIENPEYLSIYLKLTNIISYINEGLFFLGMLYASLIGSLRLYTIVYQVLDPLGEWIGEDENFTMQLIRLSMVTLMGLYVGIIKLSSSTPIIYYKLSEEDFNLEDVPFKSRLKLGINIVCCIIPVVLFTTGKIIQDQKDAGLKHGSILISTNDNVEKSNAIPIIRSNEFTYYVSVASMLYIGSGLIILTSLILVYLEYIHINIWVGLTLLIGSQGVGIPVVFLSLNLPFRKYAWRQVQGDLNNGMGCVLSWISSILKLSSSVAPVQ